MERDIDQVSLHWSQRRKLDKELPICWMTSQKIQDMIERVKTFNQVFLLIKTRVCKDREKETTLKEDQDLHLPLMLVGMPILGTLSQTIQTQRLMHIRGDKISWHLVL